MRIDSAKHLTPGRAHSARGLSAPQRHPKPKPEGWNSTSAFASMAIGANFMGSAVGDAFFRTNESVHTDYVDTLFGITIGATLLTTGYLALNQSAGSRFKAWQLMATGSWTLFGARSLMDFLQPQAMVNSSTSFEWLAGCLISILITITGVGWYAKELESADSA